MKSPTMHVDAEDKVVIDALADHMGKILDALQTFGHEGSGWAIAESSPLNEHRQLMTRQFGPQGDWTDHAAGYLGDASLLFLLAQTDHLAVLKQIFTSYTGLMFGCGPPARSLLELNAYVFWMLHPDIDSIRTRASRALLAELSDASRERTAAKDLDAPPHMLTALGERVRVLKAQVEVKLYESEIDRDKSGRLILRGEKHPGPSEALQHLSVAGEEPWNTRGAYSFLSNATHPTLHVITDTIQPATNERPSQFGHPDAVYHYRLARMSMAGILKTWQLTAAYRGLDQGPSQSLLRAIDDLPTP